METTVRHGSCTLCVRSEPVAQFAVEFSLDGMPRPIGGHWRPFNAEYDPITHHQVVSLSVAEVVARYGVAADDIERLERETLAASLRACRADEARIQRGRDDWNRMSQSERDALNEYAVRTEGHTIA